MEALVRACDSLVVSFNGIISDNEEFLSSNKINWLVISEEASSDFRSLGVEHDSTSLVGSLLESFSNAVNSLAMSLHKEL